MDSTPWEQYFVQLALPTAEPSINASTVGLGSVAVVRSLMDGSSTERVESQADAETLSTVSTLSEGGDDEYVHCSRPQRRVIFSSYWDARCVEPPILFVSFQTISDEVSIDLFAPTDTDQTPSDSLGASPFGPAPTVVPTWLNSSCELLPGGNTTSKCNYTAIEPISLSIALLCQESLLLSSVPLLVPRIDMEWTMPTPIRSLPALLRPCLRSGRFGKSNREASLVSVSFYPKVEIAIFHQYSMDWHQAGWMDLPGETSHDWDNQSGCTTGTMSQLNTPHCSNGLKV